MNIEENLNERIAAMNPTQREQLQHIFIHLVFLVENPKLQGFLMHTLPSPPESEMEPVLLHGINAIDAVVIEEMMCNFLAARNAGLAADAPRSH